MRTREARWRRAAEAERRESCARRRADLIAPGAIFILLVLEGKSDCEGSLATAEEGRGRGLKVWGEAGKNTKKLSPVGFGGVTSRA